MSVATLPPHLAGTALRPAWAPRRELQPHPREALKPVLRPLLPADCNLQVRTLTETEVVVGATLGGHRIVTRTKCPAQLCSAGDWAAEVARRLLSWRPPAAPLPPSSPTPEGSPAWHTR